MKRLLVIAAFSVAALSAAAQDNSIKQKTINVSGSSEMEIVPDEIYVQVDLREYNKRNGDKVELETIRNNFLAACKAMGLTENDISVQSYQGNDANYWWIKKNKKQNPDMKASVTYQVKLSSVEKMNELADKLDDEATQNFFIAKVWHSKMEDFKKQLKIAAIKAAKDKATYLSEAIGEKVGQALTINDPSEVRTYPQPIMYANATVRAEAYDAAQAPPMNVDFKKIKLQFEVNVIFALQ